MERIVRRLLPVLLLLALAAGCAAADPLPADPGPEGYRGVCAAGGVFLAVGTGGTIRRIAPDKTVASLPCPVSVALNGVACADGRTVAAGDGGTILLSEGAGEFRSVGSGVARDLLGVTAFGSAFVAVGRGGTVLTSVDGASWSPLSVEVSKDFISVDSDGQTCLAVTAEGQVLIMEDLSRWTVLDYNEVYKDLAAAITMRAVCCCGQNYLVMGTDPDNGDAPVLYRTGDGSIWYPVALDVINGQLSSSFYPLRPNGACLMDDQILVGTEEGKLLTLSACAECTKLRQQAEESIRALACTEEGYVLLAGDGFRFDVLAADAVRTYGIKAEQALTDQQQNGALIVDVRRAEEYAESHIPGALHIPLDRVADSLQRLVPDKETKLIFYCAVGGRSQTALETALELGYPHVYNLGGLDNGDWPYELETGPEGAFDEQETE